ncbi:MAG: hypothetical protein WBA73_16480 [Devosia sp.]
MQINTWGEIPFHPTARPWEEMLVSYSERDGPWPQAVLVPLLQHIVQAGYAKRLFGYTHRAGLFVTNYPNIVHGKDELAVLPVPPRSSVRFEYSASPLAPVEFAREYPPDQLIEKFDSFVAMVRW